MDEQWSKRSIDLSLRRPKSDDNCDNPICFSLSSNLICVILNLFVLVMVIVYPPSSNCYFSTVQISRESYGTRQVYFTTWTKSVMGSVIVPMILGMFAESWGRISTLVDHLFMSCYPWIVSSACCKYSASLLTTWTKSVMGKRHSTYDSWIVSSACCKYSASLLTTWTKSVMGKRHSTYDSWIVFSACCKYWQVYLQHGQNLLWGSVIVPMILGMFAESWGRISTLVDHLFMSCYPWIVSSACCRYSASLLTTWTKSVMGSVIVPMILGMFAESWEGSQLLWTICLCPAIPGIFIA
ncbi:hypothetical protein CEXT_257851 [Caerostris extrusa]|uniref:Uncharacterized protein n=1 Tax=Caerostris extrusa TaxID=172846 RepID=A0AAV4XJV9_CAEEX|nr:hypothetical protein CEXT_257851 [Caerostris extrusa]